MIAQHQFDAGDKAGARECLRQAIALPGRSKLPIRRSSPRSLSRRNTSSAAILAVRAISSKKPFRLR